MSRKARGHDPETQKILRELQDPQLQGILRMERPTPPNRAAARAVGAKSVEDHERELAARQLRIERFRASTCEQWLAEQFEDMLWGWLFRRVQRRPWLLWCMGIGAFVNHDREVLKGRGYPVTVLRIKWLWFTLRVKKFAWEA